MRQEPSALGCLRKQRKKIVPVASGFWELRTRRVPFWPVTHWRSREGRLPSAAIDAEKITNGRAFAKHLGECRSLLKASSERSSLDIADETPFFGRLGNHAVGGKFQCSIFSIGFSL